MSPSPRPELPEATHARDRLERIASHLGTALVGKDEVIRHALTAALCGGHLLLEDVPGVGKTTLAEALAKTFGLTFGRIQLTADLMPADILGVRVFQPAQGTFEFRPGPIFHQLVLADELNRAPPRTQSALLEAMSQAQVSVHDVSHPLPRPFWVVATQNPQDASGTYPLPDSQLDRFHLRLAVGHPAPEIEARLLMRSARPAGASGLEQKASPEALLELQALAASVSVSPVVADYVVKLAEGTRTHSGLERGVSTRACLALVASAKAHALWEARDFSSPGDVRAMLIPTWAHRLMPRAGLGELHARDEAAQLLEEIARATPAPR